MSTKIDISVNDSGDVDVKFSGDHLRKLILKRVIKGLNKQYLYNVKLYRKVNVLERKGLEVEDANLEKEINYGERNNTKESGSGIREDVSGTTEADRSSEQTNRKSENIRRLEEARRSKKAERGAGE